MRANHNRGTALCAGFALVAWLVAPAPADDSGLDEREVEASEAELADEPIPRTAMAQIEPIDGGSVTGTVVFHAEGDIVRVTGTLRNLSPGKHGFHVHEGSSCQQRGGHFAPQAEPHGSPDEQRRHVGDLGNLAVDQDGRAAYLRLDRKLALSGPESIVGKVVVVHAGEDDYQSQPSGSSGQEIACGRIVLTTERASTPHVGAAVSATDPGSAAD
jgi:Cu-Zn family superoxide dismutase